MTRAFHHYFSGRKAWFFLFEALAASLLATLGSSAAASAGAHAPLLAGLAATPSAVLALGFCTSAAIVTSLYFADLYDLQLAREDRQRGVRLLRAGGSAVALVGLASMALPEGTLPPGALLGGALGATVACLASRWGMPAVIGEPTRILLLGRGERAMQLARAVESGSEGCFAVCAMIEPASTPLSRAGEGQGEGSVLSLVEVARGLGARVVVTALDEARGQPFVDRLIECRLAGLEVYDAPAFCERVLRRLPVRTLRPSELAYADGLNLGRWRSPLGRALDVVASLVLLCVASPLMLAVALLIKLDSRGPVFYRQERVGHRGKVYRLWKFRSMRVDAERDGAVWARQQDDRVTRVGRAIRRARIDEIPQVFNVLAGEMSFVGPRPERPVFVEELKKQIPFYGLREAVKPGITGWAQIRYPYGASIEDARNKLELDLYYIKNGSPLLDLAIIFHTVRHVLRGRGAR
ncbi:MAG: sugar transferase [Myxococcales bacterium]|nr:sugar transferase [Myxococcales bacterium]